MTSLVSSCPFHFRKAHSVSQCRMFKRLSPSERFKLMVEKGPCFSCYGKHLRKDCKATAGCQVCGYKGHHHTLLHEIKQALQRLCSAQNRWLPTESLEHVNIRHVPTEINVAEIGTRGASPPCFDFDSSWQLGPAFLRDPENEWLRGPTEQVCDDPSELRTFAHSGTICVFSGNSLIDLDDYTTLWKAKRVVACVLRCVQKFKSTLTKTSVLVNRSPTVEELQLGL